MSKTPQCVAWEMFRENKHASVFDITFCVEAEVQAADCHYVDAVLKEYERLRDSARQLAESRALVGMATPEMGTDFKRTV